MVTQPKVYYRTGKGAHRHADYECANTRRALGTGDPTLIPADQVPDWAPCDVCCSAEEVTAFGEEATARLARATAENCANTGVVHKRRLQSQCQDCGKSGSVIGGRLRPHKPARPVTA
jgi:hypothetical protein